MTAIVKLSTFPRVISCLVMLFAGSLMYWVIDWAMSIDLTLVTNAHSLLVAAIFAPVAAIFKFSFDFAGDGKIDSK